MTGRDHLRMGVAGSVCLGVNAVATGNIPLAISVSTVLVGLIFPDIDSRTSRQGRIAKNIYRTTKKIVLTVLFTMLAVLVFNSYKEGGILKAILNIAYFGIPVFVLYKLYSNPFITKELGFITDHRGILHTLIPAILAFGGRLLIDNFIMNNMLLGFALGNLIHLLGDLCTYDGVPLMYPVSKLNLRIMWFRTASAKACKFVSIGWCVLFAVITVYVTFIR